MWPYEKVTVTEERGLERRHVKTTRTPQRKIGYRAIVIQWITERCRANVKIINYSFYIRGRIRSNCLMYYVLQMFIPILCDNFYI